MTGKPGTLQQALQRAAGWAPPKTITYVRGRGAEHSITYADLLAESHAVAGWIAAHGIARGEPVILTLSQNEAFVRAFWGCLFAGAVPVPLAAVPVSGRASPARDRFMNVSRLLGEPRVITDATGHQAAAGESSSLVSDVRTLRLPPRVPAAGLARDRDHDARPDDPALIQFSSGSTGTPKGIVLTHRNVMTNLAAIRAGIRVTPDDVGVNWMPLHHDLGLIGLLLGSIDCHNDLVLIETPAFVRRPLLWLDVLHAHRGTVTAAPNFGQSLVLSHLTDTSAWDLSSVRVLFNGGEPISARVMRAFSAALAPAGLAETAMFPVYGLAEATLAVTFPDLGEPPRVVTCDRVSLRTGDRARDADVADPAAMSIVSVGRPVQACEIRVVDDDDQILEDGRVGHLLVRGRHVTAGYYRDAGATAAAFHDGWLRTGDLGFVRDGRLFVTGRAKDVLFVNGQNLHAHDIEQVAMEATETTRRRVAVCGWRTGPDEHDESDRVLVFVASSNPEADAALFRTVGQRIQAVFGLRPYAMIPLISSRFPRTTSGKIQRYRLREWFERGDFEQAARHVARLIDAARVEARTAPRTEAERIVHAVWARELGLRTDQFGVYERFEELGGTSLGALSVVQAIEDRCEVALASDLVARLPTVAAIAAHIDAQARVRLPGQRRGIFRG